MKTQSILAKAKNYPDWLKLMKIWRKCTDLPKEKKTKKVMTKKGSPGCHLRNKQGFNDQKIGR